MLIILMHIWCRIRYSELSSFYQMYLGIHLWYQLNTIFHIYYMKIAWKETKHYYHSLFSCLVMIIIFGIFRAIKVIIGLCNYYHKSVLVFGLYSLMDKRCLSNNPRCSNFHLLTISKSINIHWLLSSKCSKPLYWRQNTNIYRGNMAYTVASKCSNNCLFGELAYLYS